MTSEPGGFFALEYGCPPPHADGHAGWYFLEELLASPTPLARRAERARVRLRTEHRVAVSLVVQGLVTRLVSPPLGAAARGELLVLEPRRTWWQDTPGNPFPLRVESDSTQFVSVDACSTALAETLIGPVVSPLLRHAAELAPLAPTLLRGNAASAVVGALHAVGTPPARRLACELLGSALLEGTGTVAASGPAGAFVRRTCCLLLRVPGAEPCPDCPVRHRVVGVPFVGGSDRADRRAGAG